MARLDVETIRKAKEGCPYALNRLQEHYGDYIKSLAMVRVQSADGRLFSFLNEDIRDELHMAVIKGTLMFDEKRGKGNAAD